MPLSRHVETKTQSPSSDVGYVPFVSSCLSCGGGRLVPRFVPRLALRPVSACLPRMSLGPHRLIRLSSHPLFPCPSHPLPTGSAACLIRSPLSSSHRFAPYLVSPGSPSHRQAGRGETTIDGWRRLVMRLASGRCRGCLLTLDVERRKRRAIIGGGIGWRMAAGVGVSCLLASGRWTERLGHLSSPSHRLISSATVPGSSNHPIDGELASFPFRLIPSPRLSSLCLLELIPRPRAEG